LSPAVLLEDFRDPWSQITLSLAREAMAIHAQLGNAPPLLLSLVIGETALRSKEALREFLDIISLWDVAGIYLIVHFNDPTYPAFVEETTLANLMYFVYVMARVNGYEVVYGYSDVMSCLLHAVGAHATATGWFHSLRQFSIRRFQPTTGGRQPRPRYLSGPLLSSVLVVPELSAIYEVGRIEEVLSSTRYDSVMATGNPANAPWPRHKSCLHRWEVLGHLAAEFSLQESTKGNLELLKKKIRSAQAIYSLLTESNVVFESPVGRDLRQWSDAVRSFETGAAHLV